MKIGILTLYYRNHNFGGQLQAYALCTFMNSMKGVTCEQISYDYKEKKKASVKSTLFSVYSAVFHPRAMLGLKKRKKKFETFEETIPHSKVISNEIELKRLSDNYDYVFAGSDQVWNPEYAGGAFYLATIPDKKALELVKKDYPDLHVNLFGVYNLPEDLPDWFSYTKNANSDQLFNLYNKSAIFVCASIEEGFGLTGAEAMACGCALVSTNYKGVYEYARDKENALLSPINDAEALARNIKKLIKNEDLRQKIAKQGSNDLSYFSWKNAIDKFEGLIVQEGNVG